MDVFERFVCLREWEETTEEWNPGTVPAPSFRELIIRRELNREQPQEVFDTIRAALQSRTLPDISVFKDTVKCVANMLAIGGRFSSMKQNPNAWTSATIVIVADTGHEIVLTGGSKPVSLILDKEEQVDKEDQVKKQKKLPTEFFLKDRAEKICRARLGPIFFSIINECSHEFSKNASKKDDCDCVAIVVKHGTDKEIDDLYQKVLTWPQVGQHSRIQCNTVYSWAFDGHTFEPKDPCVRCRYLYSSWHLAKEPDTPAGKLAELRQLGAHQMKYHEEKDPPCGYCAESVAAAQWFALDNGPRVATG